jgi:hypothetical protein
MNELNNGKVSNLITTAHSARKDITVEECYKKSIASVMLYTCGKKKYDELEIELIIAGNGVIPFPEVDSENPDARLFVGYVRANKEFTTDASDLIELLLFPIHEKVSVNTEIAKMLSESNLSDSFISRVVTSSDCRISLQLYI